MRTREAVILKRAAGKGNKLPLFWKRGTLWVGGVPALGQKEVKAANLFGGAAAECPGASSPFQLLMPFYCITDQKEQSTTANLENWVCVLWGFVWCVLPSPALNSFGFSRLRLAGCCAPKQRILRPFAVLLPALLTVVPCQTHPLPSVPFGSAGAEYLSAPR